MEAVGGSWEVVLGRLEVESGGWNSWGVGGSVNTVE